MILSKELIHLKSKFKSYEIFLFCFFLKSAPFTIQRLCELILSPRAHYRRTDKFIRGLIKCVSVVTTIDNEGK